MRPKCVICRKSFDKMGKAKTCGPTCSDALKLKRAMAKREQRMSMSPDENRERLDRRATAFNKKLLEWRRQQADKDSDGMKGGEAL